MRFTITIFYFFFFLISVQRTEQYQTEIINRETDMFEQVAPDVPDVSNQ